MTATATHSGRPSLRFALRLGTALATTLFAAGFGPAALAQVMSELPVIGGGSDGGAAITTNGSGTDMQIDLLGANKVINWTSYSVGQPNTVNYITTSNTAQQLAVLNRVIGMNVSRIDGTVTSQPNIVVWLSNPNGIMVGATGNFNTGGLVLTTLGVTDAEFLNSTTPGSGFRLAGLDAAGVTLAPGSSVVTSGSAGGFAGSIILAAPSLSIGGLVRAGGTTGAQGDVALVAAQDVSFATGVGSPLALTIHKGTPLGGTLEVLGTAEVAGGSVAVVGASDATVMGALLNVNIAAGATLTATADGGAVILATAPVAGIGFATADMIPVATTNDDSITVAGTLTATGGGMGGDGSVLVAADGDATLTGTVTTAGSGLYRVTGDNVVLGGAGMAAQSGAGSVDIDATDGNLTIAGDLALSSGGTIALTATGTATSGGAITAGGDYSVDAANVVLGNSAAAVVQSAIGSVAITPTAGPTALAGNVTLAGASGTLALGVAGGGNDLTLNFGGVTALDGSFIGIDDLATGGGGTTSLTGTILTGGSQTYNDAVTLAGDTTLTSSGGGAITLAGTVDGAQALTVATTGVTTFGGAVGGATALSSLTTDAGGGTALDGGSVATSGAQTYGDQVTLGADTVLTAGSASLAAGIVGGGNDLTLTVSGLTTLGGGISGIEDLATDAGGTTSLTGTILTGGSQTYNDAVTLAGDTTLTSSGGGAITLAGTVDGAQALTVATTGVTTFGGAVGGATALSSLTTDAGGGTALDGGSVATSGAQTYGDQVTLGADTVLTAGSASLAAGIVGAGNDLTLTVSGLTTLGGGISGIEDLATDAGGTTSLTGTILTTATQTYGDAVTLAGDTTLTSSGGGAITLAGTVDGAQALTVATTGVTTFGGAVGGATALSSLTTDAGGGTALDGGSVATSGAQTYGDQVTLGADTVLTAGSASLAAGIVGAGNDLTLTVSGLTTLGGGISGIEDLATDAGGTTSLTGTILTTATQTYGDAVTLAGDTTLTSSGGGAITLAGTVDGAQALTVATTGVTTFGGAVGGATALSSLTTDAGGGTALDGGSVATSGAQTYGDQVTLGADTVLTAGSASLAAGIVGAGNDLTLTVSGLTTLGGGISGIEDLATDAGGTTSLTGTILTTATQTYGDAVTLAGDTTLTSSGGGAITLEDGADGAFGLTIGTAGAVNLLGVTGDAAPLASLAITGGDVVVDTATVAGAVTVDATGDAQFTRVDAGGSIAIDAGDDVLIAAAGVLDSAGGSITIDAGGSLHAIGSSENTLPATARGIANLTVGGDLTVTSDGDARFGTVVAGGGIDLTIDGSLTGLDSATAAIDGSTFGAALRANGAGGTVTVRVGLADAGGTVNDVIALSSIVADGTVSLSADEIAVGSLTSANGTVVLTDTAAMPLSPSDYYIGQLTVAGDFTYVLTGQATAPIALVVPDAMGASEFFDAAFGKVDLQAGTDLTGTIGQAAQLGNVTVGTTADLTAAALVADTLTTGTGAAAFLATTGTLSVIDAAVGSGGLTLTKQGGSATTVGDELRASTVAGTGAATLTSATHVRTDSITTAGNISLTASGGDITATVTGTPGASSTTFTALPTSGYDNAAQLTSSAGAITAAASGVGLFGTVAAAQAVTLGAAGLLVTAANSTSGAVSLTASDGTLALGSASAGTDLTLTKQGGSGAGNDLRVTGALVAGAANGLSGSATLTSNTDLRVSTVTAFGGDIAIDAGGEVTRLDGSRADLFALDARDATGGAVAGTAGKIDLIAGGLVLLGDAVSGTGLTVTSGAATGAGRIDMVTGRVTDGSIALTSTNTTSSLAGVLVGTLDAQGKAGSVSVLSLGATSGDADVGRIDATGNVDVRSQAGLATPDVVVASGDVAIRGVSVETMSVTGRSVGIVADVDIDAGTITASEDVGLMAGGAIAVGGATAAGDDVTATGAQVTLAAVTATGTGPDTRHIEFGAQSVSFVEGETSPALDGANIVANAGAGGAELQQSLVAARDVSITSLGATTVASDVTAGRDYTVESQGPILLGGAGAVTQQAGGDVTISSTAGEVRQSAGRLTLVANSDATPANNADKLIVQAATDVLLGNAALIGGAVAGRESDIEVITDSGVVTLGKVDGASLLVRAADDVTILEGVDAGNAARGADATNSFATIDIASSGGDIALPFATTYGAGHDIALDAAGDVTGLALVAMPGAATLVTTGTVLAVDHGAANLTTTGSATVDAGGAAQIGTVLAGDNATITAAAATLDSAVATVGALSITATTGTLRLGTGSSGTDTTLTKQGGSQATPGDELRVATLTTGGRATLTSSTHVRVGTITAAGDIGLTATGGDVTGLALDAPDSGNPDPAFGRATLTSTGANVLAIANGLVQLGAVDAAMNIEAGAGFPVGSGSSGAIDITSAVAGGSLSLVAYGFSSADPARDGDIVLGTGNVGGTAVIDNSAGTTGDVIITNSLTAGGAVLIGGNAVSIRSADDVLIGPYVQGATPSLDSGFVRAGAGSIEVVAAGSVHGIGGDENALPTTQRGIAALTASGDLTIRSDGDVRFDNLGAGGSLTLDIAGSLTGAPTGGGSATGTNVPGGALFAQGPGGDVTVRAGAAGSPSNDVITLNRIVADRDITLSADQLAVGSLTTNSGTITLNDTSGSALSAANYYVGQLNAAGDVTVVLTGQDTAPISLVAIDGLGSPEFFDTAFGKTDLVAGSSISGTIGQAAQLGSVTFGTTINLDTAALVANSVASTTGTAVDLLATTGTLSVLDNQLPLASLTLTKQGGTAATLGDELRAANVAAGGAVTLASSTSIRSDTIAAAGDVSLTASGGDVTATTLVASPGGSTLVTTGTVLSPDYGLIDIASSGGSVQATASGVLQADQISAAQNVTLSAAALSVNAITAANGALSATATAGTLRLGSGTAGTDAVLTKQGGLLATAGDELRVDTLLAGALDGATGSASLTSSTHTRAGEVTARGGNVTLAAADGEVTGLAGGRAVLTAAPARDSGGVEIAGSAGAVSVTSGLVTRLGAVTAGSGVFVTAGGSASAARDGAVDLISATTSNGPIVLSVFNDLAGSPNGIVFDTLSASDGGVFLSTRGSNGGDIAGNTITTILAPPPEFADVVISAARDVRIGTIASDSSIAVAARRDIVISGTSTAGEDAAFSAGGNLALGAIRAGDDITVSGVDITLASAASSGAGRDDYVVTFPGGVPSIDQPETIPGANIVVTASGSATAAGDLSAPGNIFVTAGTTAAVERNVTAGGDYGVTGGTGVTLGDAVARTQAAGGAVTITATAGDVTKGAGRLTVVANADRLGTEALSITASSGNIVLADSQLTGGSEAGRESDVVLSASGAITADDVDGDRVAFSAGGNIALDTIQAGTGAADSGDLAERQSIDLVSTGGSITLNSAQAIGAGHDIDLRAATGITANTLEAGGSLVGRAGDAVLIGTAAAGEDIALRSNTSTITITGASSAGDDVLLTAPGAIVVNGVTASGTGPDTRTVVFGSGAPLDAAYAAESNAGADIVAASTGASFTATGALLAASDVTVTAATSATHLATTTATGGNVTVTSGTSTQLVGDVVSGVNTTVTAGTTAAVERNVTAGGDYGVTGGTGVTLGDAVARTQAAGGAVTITATAGDVTKGAGRLTVVANADRLGTEALSITASSGNIVLADSQLTGGSEAGRESDVVLSASGAITADDVDGDRVAFSAGGNIALDTIQAGTGAADSGDLAERQSIDLVSTGGSITLNSAQAIGAGHDIDLRAATGITANTLEAGGSLVGRAGDAVLIGTAAAGEDIALRSNTSTITITGASSAGDDVLLTAPGAIVVNGVTASGTGPDTRTVVFGSGAPLDAAYAAESNAGADIVAASTGASFTATGALLAASDVTVTAATSATHLATTTATGGNVTVTSGTSTQLVGDVVSGVNTTVTAGTTAAVERNVTAGGDYGVTGGTGVTLGDAVARTQAAGGAVTITATAGDVTKGAGRLTVVANADRLGTEALSITASSGNIVLADSQLTGGSEAGRESDVVLSASGAITADDVDGDRVAFSAGGNIALDTIQAGTGAADSGDLAERQSIDLVSTGGSITLNSAQAIGAGHDIDLRAATGITANTLEAGGSLVGRAGDAVLIGTAAAGEDIALRSNTSTITITGASSAGDDVLLTAPGAIVVNGVTASGTGPDTRTVVFGSGAPLDAAYAAESNAGADIVAASTGASFTATGALLAASDVTVTAATSATHLATTTATGGNVTVTSGTSTQLVGDVVSGVNTTVTAGTTAAVERNVTAGGDYGVTGGTGVTLGDAVARTQAAGGAVTITATAGDVTKGAGRLTVVANADRLGTEALSITASSGNIVLADSQLTGGSEAGRESDVVLSASGAITADDVDGDRVAFSAGGNIALDTIQAGTGAADSGDLAERQSIDLVSTGGSITLNSAQAIGAGHDIDLRAATGITANTLEAGGSLVGRAGDAVLIGTAAAGEDIALRSNTSTITITGASSAGDDVLLTAPGAIVVNGVTASGTGPDTRTVVFGSGAPLDAAYAAESNAGADIVAASTGASFTATGALLAASDVTVTAATSATHLATTTATGGNVTVTSGTSTQLVGDVVSGVNTTVTAGTTAAVERNVTAGGDYGVTGGTGVTLGDAVARTQAAGGAVTITATAGDVTKGAGRLTVVANADRLGTEALSITASSGNIVLADSQLTGGSEAGRESDVVLSASGAITADDVDGDRVAFSAGGNIALDTIQAGTGAADSGDLAERQSIDLVSTGGSITLNSAQAIGAGHDIDLRAATGITANTLEAGGSLVGRAGDAVLIGTAAAGEDIALRSNTSTITITGASSAGDDVLLTAPGAIVVNGVTASGTGPDTRTVVFGSGAPLDAAYAAESNAGADIVAASTGASFTATGALLAASDVTVTAATSATHLATTTATGGNVTVTSGTSTQLVGDVVSGVNTTVTAGTTAAVERNVTAGGDYGVTGGTGVTLGDAVARTQAAGGAVTITATAGDVTKGAGRLTVVANADRTAANNAETLAISAANGAITLANSQLTGGSIAGRESDIRVNARSVTLGKVDGASLNARAVTGFTAGEAIVAGNAARGADPVAGARTVDIAVSGGGLSFTDITATNAGHDVTLAASGAVSGANITAARTVLINGGSVAVSGATNAGSGSVTVGGGSSAALGSLSAATTGTVTAGTINVGSSTTGGTINLNATGSTLTLGSATSGGDVTLAAATRATLGPITATGRNVSLTAADADVNGNIAAAQITVLNRGPAGNALRLGDGSPGSGGFALGQAEVNRLNAATVILDAGTSGGTATQDVSIGTLALDADSGANRFEIRARQRIDVTGTLAATGNGSRAIRIGGDTVDTTRATTIRVAATADGGGRLLLPGVDLELRADRIGVGQDAGFLAALGLTPGGSPAAQTTVETAFIANGASTLYNAQGFTGGSAYTNQQLLQADSLTVRYSDYALFQNTGGTAANAGATIASLATPGMPALSLGGPNPPEAGGFAIFGTINGVGDSAAAVLGDQVIRLNAVDRLTARVNGCVIASGSGCIASTTDQPPLPPLNAFRGDIFSTTGDLSVPFDPVVGTNNESLFGDVGTFGLSDLPLPPLECDPNEDAGCERANEEPAS